MSVCAGRKVTCREINVVIIIIIKIVIKNNNYYFGIK